MDMFFKGKKASSCSFAVLSLLTGIQNVFAAGFIDILLSKGYVFRIDSVGSEEISSVCNEITDEKGWSKSSQSSIQLESAFRANIGNRTFARLYPNYCRLFLGYGEPSKLVPSFVSGLLYLDLDDAQKFTSHHEVTGLSDVDFEVMRNFLKNHYWELTIEKNRGAGIKVTILKTKFKKSKDRPGIVWMGEDAKEGKASDSDRVVSEQEIDTIVGEGDTFAEAIISATRDDLAFVMQYALKRGHMNDIHENYKQEVLNGLITKEYKINK